MVDVLQWSAVAFVAAQLYLIGNGDYKQSWLCCLTACALWVVVAIQAEMWGLLAQQFVIIALSARGLYKGQNK